MQRHRVAAEDGLQLAAFDHGNRAGREILFIHGFSQASACWSKQFSDSALANEFRLSAFDIRGHGESEKPLDPARYAEDQLFAGDVQSVMTALGLKRPVLVGWSYAGRIIADYISAYGGAQLAGINYVCAETRSNSGLYGPGVDFIDGMVLDDPVRNLEATRSFLTSCYARPPSPEEFEAALSYNMAMPAAVRAAHLERPGRDGGILATLDIPVLVTHGTADAVIQAALSEWTAAAVPRSRLSLYEGIGHAPFFEDAQRFNRELAEFVRSTA